MGLQPGGGAIAWPVTVEDAKTFIRVDSDDDDALIETLIEVACEHLEGIVGRSIATRSWELTLDGFSDAIELPRAPVRSLDSFTYTDADGATQTVDAASYTVDLTSFHAWIVRNSGSSWPTTMDAINVVTIGYTAGYEPVPRPLRAAILLTVGDLYAFRETAVVGTVSTKIQTSAQVDALIANFRDWG